jgi:hypothetical protein
MKRNPYRHWAQLILCAAAQAPYTYVHHTVSTSFPAAQFAFDRGLTLVFAYDSEEAERAFREAARLDPSLAMAWWGIALAVGPNINDEPEPKSTLIAADSIARAKLLASQRATAQEREYIDALSARYSGDPKPDFDQLAVAYRDAMRALVGRNPNDADAAALYAESIMDLHPWMLWSVDGKPAPDTEELVALLENVAIPSTSASCISTSMRSKRATTPHVHWLSRGGSLHCPWSPRPPTSCTCPLIFICAWEIGPQRSKPTSMRYTMPWITA